MSLLHHDVQQEAFAVASHFRDDFFDCLPVRGDTLFELTDALLCADGPVTTPVDLTLTAEHRRGHGAMYDALNSGNVDVPRLRQVLAGLPQPEAADGRLVLAVDVTHWLRPDAPTSPDRLFCHVYGRSGRSSDQFVPGWPYSFVAAHTQLRLARTLAADLRRPWEKPAEPGRLTPARVRRGFRNLRRHLPCPTHAPKPNRPGPGRPLGSKNRHPATRYDVGKTVRRPETIAERDQVRP
ncbi:transposase [Streptomyces sp. NPDC056188]|uniref:transposase n=1 Tax=Streptomyces sp. NPDC056188 TaxID=3345740 RepID=UPI0035DA9C1D